MAEPRPCHETLFCAAAERTVPCGAADAVLRFALAEVARRTPDSEPVPIELLVAGAPATRLVWPGAAVADDLPELVPEVVVDLLT